MVRTVTDTFARHCHRPGIMSAVHQNGFTKRLTDEAPQEVTLELADVNSVAVGERGLPICRGWHEGTGYIPNCWKAPYCLFAGGALGMGWVRGPVENVPQGGFWIGKQDPVRFT